MKLLCFFIFIGSTAYAELPQGKRLTVNNITYQGYTLDEMKILLKLDADIKLFSEKIKEQLTITRNQALAITSMHKQLESKDKQVSMLKVDSKRLLEKWTKENKARHLCENKPAFGSAIAWSAAAVATAVAVVLAIVLVVKRD